MDDVFQINKANINSALKDYELIIDEFNRPLEVNISLLLQIIKENKDSEYGKKYGFDKINCYDDYKKTVPIICYDDISSYVNRMISGEKNILTSYLCSHMNETSGTVGKPKFIPMTDKQYDVFIKYNKHYMDAFYLNNFGEDWMKGRIFCTSQGKHSISSSGITLGDASSVMASYIQGGRQEIDKKIRVLYTSPVEATIPDEGLNTKYIHTRFALEDANVTAIISGYFTMIVQYLHYIAENYDMLITDIENGTINDSVDLPCDVKQSLLRKIKPNPVRALELREIFNNGSDFKFVSKVWPNMQFFCGVGGDGFSVYANTIRELYADDSIKFILNGITASEGLWSIPVEVNNEDSVLTPGSAFLEFLPIEAENDFSKIVTIDKLEIGKIYELIITNLSGLYRYRMSDAVKVTGMYKRTPKVRFMYRINKTVNLAAEHTTEKAIQITVEQTANELGINISDYIVYPNAKIVPPRYEFLIQPEDSVKNISLEKLSDTIYNYLIKNNEFYEVCIKENSMQKPVAYWLQPESTYLWRDLEIMHGESASQLKPLRTIQNEEQRKFFYAFIE